jgi:hypothetical protein
MSNVSSSGRLERERKTIRVPSVAIRFLIQKFRVPSSWVGVNRTYVVSS